MRLHRRSEADTTGSVRFEVLTCRWWHTCRPEGLQLPPWVFAAESRAACSILPTALAPPASQALDGGRLGLQETRSPSRQADIHGHVASKQRDEPCALRPDAPAHAAPPSTPLTPLRRVLAARARPLCRVGAAPWPSTGAQRPLTLPVLSDVARAKGSVLQTGGTSSPEEGPCASGHCRLSGRRAELSSPPPSVGRAVLQPSRGTFSGSGKCVSVKSDFERC